MAILWSPLTYIKDGIITINVLVEYSKQKKRTKFYENKTQTLQSSWLIYGETLFGNFVLLTRYICKSLWNTSLQKLNLFSCHYPPLLHCDTGCCSSGGKMGKNRSTCIMIIKSFRAAAILALFPSHHSLSPQANFALVCRLNFSHKAISNPSGLLRGCFVRSNF